MKNPAEPLESPKYTLKLFSSGMRKKTEEAKSLLKEIYPFEVKKENILILRTNKKNIYDVYISEVKNNTKKTLSQCILILSIVLAIVISVCFATVNKSKAEKAKRISEKEQEEKIINEEKIKKEKEKEFLLLEKKFTEEKLNHYEKIYPLIERLYYVIGSKNKVKDISINRKDFSVLVESNDSIKILENFENSSAFENVKMTKTSLENEKENTFYTGKFSTQIKTSENFLTLEEKIEFYKKEIAKMQDRKEKQEKEKLSEYIKTIRENLRKNNCTEQYIQVKNAEKIAEVEVFAVSESVNILRFIKNLQDSTEEDENETLFDIKNISLRTSEKDGNVQLFMVFKTGINLDEENVNKEIEKTEYSPDAVAKIFYSAPKKEIKAANTKKIDINENKNVPEKLKSLSYIGQSKMGGKTIIIAKDLDFGSIYKLELSETEIDGDYCILENNGYKAKIKGKFYEVKK